MTALPVSADGDNCASDERRLKFVQKKDPRRQLIGLQSRTKGKVFESRLDASFAYYEKKGFAIVEKTPEPMKVIRNMGGGKFLAVFEKKGQPDYKGTVNGGRSVLFEAKFTATDRLEQSRVSETQTNYLNRHQTLGAECYVLAGFASGEVYLVPWGVWCNMKNQFGRKYVTEADLTQYQLKHSWNDVLMIF